MDRWESEARRNKYKVSFIMVHHAMAVIAAALAIAMMHTRVSLLQEYFSTTGKSCEELYPLNMECCNLTKIFGMTKRPADLSIFQSYFSFPYILFGSSIFLLTGFWIFCKQQVTGDGSFNVKSYLVFGWFFQLCNCVLFGTSIDSLKTSAPSFLAGLCNDDRPNWTTRCLRAPGLCIKTRPFTIYLVILIIELVLYLPAVIFLHLKYMVDSRSSDQNILSEDVTQRYSEEGDSNPTNMSQVTGRRQKGMLRLALRLVLVWAVTEALYNLRLGQDTVIFWELDYKAEEFIAEIHTKNVDNRLGWIGVGFSTAGNVTDGSGDFCVAWKNHLVYPNAPFQVTDVHIINGTKELEPDAQQDCVGFQYLQHNDTIKWTFRRKFITCDRYDYPLEEGTTHLHWVKGDGPLYDIKGVSVAKATDSGFNRIRFLKNANPLPPVNPRTAWSFDILNKKVKIMPVETTYWCHIVKLPEDLRKRHHVVQFEANIQHGNEALVHHMEVFHCETDVNTEMPLYSGPCEQSPPEIKVCSRVIGAWAMGAEPLRYPPQTGFPIGGQNFNPYVRLEMHYNNPLLKPDWVDSSGMKFWVSEKLRQFDAGVMELGLEYTDKMAIPPRFHNFQLTGICNRECTSVGIPASGITVFASQLHTHLTGTRVVTRHFRMGEAESGTEGRYIELPPLNYDNHYSTHYQEIRQLKNPTRILPGDVLLTTCEFDTVDRSEITLGGFAISDEMCVNYIHYYPRSKLEVCKSSISYKSLSDYFSFMKTMEGQNIDPEGPISSSYKGIKWTPFRSRLLSDFYNRSPIDMQCNQSDGSRFPGSWNSMPTMTFPTLQERPDPNQECMLAPGAPPGDRIQTR
ncbi:unnamed protein product [Allacma fusca]|uniref:DOMON domain-containing protein n=1 Tax=Allacma fusca TaxID=39272 RepID=A0A8J2P3X6_9HEXA|nr:unnamed protein product [Allacma fusca]